MSSTRKAKTSYVILALGIILIAAAVGLYGVRTVSSHIAASHARDVMTEMSRLIPQYADDDPKASGEMGTPLPQIEIDGTSFIGYLEFKQQEAKIPVAADDYDGKEFASRAGGWPSSGPFMISGRDNDGAMGILDEIKPGDDITFVDVNGTRRTYTVTNLGSVKASDDADDIKEDMVLYTGISRNVMFALFAEEQH